MLHRLKRFCARHSAGLRYGVTRRLAADVPVDIEFFTLVLNGMPFIQHHIETFKQLKVSWRWHIVEGLAELKHDTAWSVAAGGRIPDKSHRQGLSVDGTAEYVNQLAREFPGQVIVHRKTDGRPWNGKVEMCNAPLPHIKRACLLWQLDVDEFWTSAQIETAVSLFRQQPLKTAAWFFCRFFVGSQLVLTTRDCYANNPAYEWLRIWRYLPGMVWEAHEPPTLILKTLFGSVNIGTLNPILHEETEANGLIFEHYAYVLPQQLEFKEHYYGYKNALFQWQKLQAHQSLPVKLKDYLSWADEKTWADRGQPKILNLQDFTGLHR